MLDMWKCVALQELRGPYRPHSARPPKPRRLSRSRTPVICLPKCTHTHASDHRREAGPQATLPQHNGESSADRMSAGIPSDPGGLTASLHRWPSSPAAQCSRWPRAPGFSLVFPLISLSCPIQGAYSLAYSLRIRLYTPGARRPVPSVLHLSDCPPRQGHHRSTMDAMV